MYIYFMYIYIYIYIYIFIYSFTCGSVVKNPLASARDIRDLGLIPGSGRAPGERNGSLLEYSYVENPMDRGAWQATVHGDAKSWT